MRITIDVDGDRIAAINPDAVAPAYPAVPGMHAADAPPGPAPAELLERARKLGALSGGPAQLGGGPGLAGASLASETAAVPAAKPPRRRKAKKT